MILLFKIQEINYVFKPRIRCYNSNVIKPRLTIDRKYCTIIYKGIYIGNDLFYVCSLLQKIPAYIHFKKYEHSDI